jgi:hypothetical protein
MKTTEQGKGMAIAPISAAEAARQISTLINAKASSPRLEELEAIVARVAVGVASAQPSREHLDYRTVTAEAEACTGADEAELTRLMDRESDFAQQIWDRPVENWFDVFLLAEVALYHENGILESLEKPEPYHDELAVAKLIKAAIAIGRRHYG